MSDARTLAEELDYMGRRTTDPEASDLLIQAAQEVAALQAKYEDALRDGLRLRTLLTEVQDTAANTAWTLASIAEFSWADSGCESFEEAFDWCKETAKDALVAALTEDPTPSETEDEK